MASLAKWMSVLYELSDCLFKSCCCHLNFRYVKLPRLKLVRIMLETSNLVRKYTHIFSLKKYIFQGQGPLNFVDVSIFSQRISFFGKKVPSFKAMV